MQNSALLQNAFRGWGVAVARARAERMKLAREATHFLL